MQAVLDNQEAIENKNLLLQPLFRDLKAQIRHMTHTPEFELISDYVKKRTMIEQSSADVASDPGRTEAAVKTLELQYAKLLALRQRKLQAKSSLRIQTL